MKIAWLKKCEEKLMSEKKKQRKGLFLVNNMEFFYGPANLSFRRQIPCTIYFIIIIYYEVFLYFFPNQFLRSSLRKSGNI